MRQVVRALARAKCSHNLLRRDPRVLHHESRACRIRSRGLSCTVGKTRVTACGGRRGGCKLLENVRRNRWAQGKVRTKGGQVDVRGSAPVPQFTNGRHRHVRVHEGGHPMLQRSRPGTVCGDEVEHARRCGEVLGHTSPDVVVRAHREHGELRGVGGGCRERHDRGHGGRSCVDESVRPVHARMIPEGVERGVQPRPFVLQ